MWKKFISSIGFSNVTVDTLLEKTKYQPGETIVGKIEVKGGMYDKQIEGIVLTLILKYEADKVDSDFSYHEKEINELVLRDIQHIPSNEISIIPFSMFIPTSHNKTKAGIETILRTKLLVSHSLNPQDEDTIVIA